MPLFALTAIPRLGSRRFGPVPATRVCAVALVILSGCTSFTAYINNGFKVGPNYCPPEAPIATQWIDAKDSLVSERAPNLNLWWTVFGDPVLNHLIEIASLQNPNLQAASWRIREARALRGVAVGELFPQQQQLNAGYSRINQSRNFINHARFPNYSEWIVGPSLSWELDFWGQYRRTIEAADASFAGSIENYRDVQVILFAEVAANYVQIRVLDQTLSYTRQNLAMMQDSLDLANNRFEAGIVSRLDVSQAEGNLENQKSRVPEFESLRRQATNRLCILLGMPPREVGDFLDDAPRIPMAPPQVAVGIPADLLRQRPDIRQAERRVAEQSARIGIATAQLYPHFSIDGSIAIDSSSFNQLFEPNSFTGIIRPSFRWDILNYGRLLNGIRANDARFQQSAFQYQTVVLKAHAEAENALIGFLKAQQRLSFLVQSAEATKRAVGIAFDQYAEGKINFNRLFTLQRFLTEQQDRLAEAQGDVPLNLILLYKALGGGWQLSAEAPDTDIAVPQAVQVDDDQVPFVPEPLPPRNFDARMTVPVDNE